MSDWITSIVETIGYAGIAGLMVLEIFIPLVQSEIVMTFAGFTASAGDLHVAWVVVAGVVGSQAGSLALYAVFRPISEDRANELIARYGGWLGFDQGDLERAQDWFRRWDHWAVLVGRLVPGLRSLVAVPAGIQRMPVGEFFVFNLFGTAFWVSVLTTLGWVLGDNYELVDRYSSFITYVLAAAVAAYVAFRLVVLARRHWFGDRNSTAET